MATSLDLDMACFFTWHSVLIVGPHIHSVTLPEGMLRHWRSGTGRGTLVGIYFLLFSLHTCCSANCNSLHSPPCHHWKRGKTHTPPHQPYTNPGVIALAAHLPLACSPFTNMLDHAPTPTHSYVQSIEFCQWWTPLKFYRHLKEIKANRMHLRSA